MSDSTSNLDTISQSQSQKETTANALFDAGSPATIYGRRASTTSGLTWGYYGGTFSADNTARVSIANGTVALTGSATNYVEADGTTGVVSVNTSAFTSGDVPLYKVVCGASTVTSYEDWRVPSMSAATGGGLPAGSNTQIQYNDSGAFGASANFTFDGSGVYLAGSLGLGLVPYAGIKLTIGGAPTASSGNCIAVYADPTIPSGATSTYATVYSFPVTQAAAFTLSNASHFLAQNMTLGSGSSITTQAGFFVADLTSGTNNYGFHGTVTAGANKWNLYMAGTASNYLAGALGINATSISASALLQIDSTTQGFLPPRMTTTQRNAIASPAEGLVVYNTTTDTLDVYNGSAWGGAQPYDVGGMVSGAPSASLVCMRYPFPRAVAFPSGMTSSQGVAGTAATAQTDFDLRKNNVSFGTMRFAAAGTVASFIAASATSFAASDVLTVVAPASPDATLANVGFSLAGTR